MGGGGGEGGGYEFWSRHGEILSSELNKPMFVTKGKGMSVKTTIF